MEIRGVGIIDVQAVFGIRGIRMKKRIEALVELKDWDAEETYERLGLEDRMFDILGEAIPKIELAIYPGKAIAAGRNESVMVSPIFVSSSSFIPAIT